MRADFRPAGSQSAQMSTVFPSRRDGSHFPTEAVPPHQEAVSTPVRLRDAAAFSPSQTTTRGTFGGLVIGAAAPKQYMESLRWSPGPTRFLHLILPGPKNLFGLAGQTVRGGGSVFVLGHRHRRPGALAFGALGMAYPRLNSQATVDRVGNLFPVAAGWHDSNRWVCPMAIIGYSADRCPTSRPRSMGIGRALRRPWRWYCRVLGRSGIGHTGRLLREVGSSGSMVRSFFEFALCYLRLVPIRRPALSALNTSKQRHGEANPHGRQYKHPFALMQIKLNA